MKKTFILLSIVPIAAFAQVGINTDSPKATLQVMRNTSPNAVPDGIIAPQLTGNNVKANDSLYGNDQIGAILYVTEAANPTSAKTINVTSAGYYYFDGIVWVKLAAGSAANPLTADNGLTKTSDNVQLGGTLLKNTDITTAGYNATFSGSGSFGIGTAVPVQKLDVRGSGRFEAPSASVELYSTGANASSLNLIRNNNASNLTNGNLIGYFNFNGRVNNSDNVPLATIVSTYRGNGVGNESTFDFRTSGTVNHDMILNENGNLGVGNNILPTERLDVDGSARVRTIPVSSNISDITLVADANGVIKKKKNEATGVFRGYMAADQTTPSGSSIYRITNLNEMTDPGNNMNPTNGYFVPAESGIYKVTLTFSSKKSGTPTAPNYAFGLAYPDASSSVGSTWVMRFSVPLTAYDNTLGASTSPVGISQTFQGIAQLTAGTQYFFGLTQEISLISNPTGTTGTGIGSFFEIQQIK